MKTRKLVAVAAILAFALTGSISSAWGEPQEAPPKKGHQIGQTSPFPSETTPENQGGPIGGMNDTTTMQNVSVIAQVDSMMQRMIVLKEKAQSDSKSFGVLAAGHHGTDKTEILMMKRMSDSMGMMAGEIEVSLQQYKEMLKDETGSENGSMNAEVQNLTVILYGIARYVDGAVNTLHTLDERLGQG